MPTRTEPRTFAVPQDLKDSDVAHAGGSPGGGPFTRGVRPDMYRGCAWTMRQYSGFATAAPSNRRFPYLLAQGV